MYRPWRIAARKNGLLARAVNDIDSRLTLAGASFAHHRGNIVVIAVHQFLHHPVYFQDEGVGFYPEFSLRR